MVYRLVAYRVAVDSQRSGRSRGAAPRRSIVETRRRLIGFLAHRPADAEPVANDYLVGVGAGISARQTPELYEESGTGPFVREVLANLEREGLIRVGKKPRTGPFSTITPTEMARNLPLLQPWYRRWLRFFDPPPGTA